MLADQDFEDMFLADTQARLGRVTLKEHDHVAMLPLYHLPSIGCQDHSAFSQRLNNSMILLFPPGWIIQLFLYF